MSAAQPAEPPAPRPIDPQWIVRLPIIAVVAMLAALLSDRARSEPGLVWSIFGAALLGGIWALTAVFRARAAERPLVVELAPRSTDLLRIAALGIVYGYWAWHHPPTAEQMVLVAAQIPFAYLLDMGLGWRRRGRLRLGLAPIPLVGAINLFLWMTDALFAVHFAMIAIAYASREYLRWRRPGRERPVFNPAGLALALVCGALIATGGAELARGQEIAASLGAGPHAYLAIFVAGLIVQVRAPVVLVTLSAVAVDLALGAAWTAATGTWFYIDTAIPIAAFLAMTLLVADRDTAPRNGLGQVLFGAAYGLSVFALYAALDAFGDGWGDDITWCGALLAVPLVDLLAPAFERLGAALTPGRLADRLSPPRWSAVHVAVYVAVFALARPALRESPGRAVDPWVEACAREATGACHRLRKVYDTRCVAPAPPAGCDAAAPMVLPEACAAGLPLACALYGRMLALGTPAIPADPAAAIAPLERACDGGRADACGQLGLMLWKGHGAGIDTNRADTLLDRACQGAIAESCLHQAQMFDAVGPPGSRYRGIELLERGCTLGHPGACATAGEWFATGHGVHASRRQARQLLGRACELGLEPACRRRDEVARDDGR